MNLFSTPLPFKELTHKLEVLVRGRLWLQALIGLGLGLGLGILLGPDAGYVDLEQAEMITNWIALPGELFLRLIKMILIPLLVASIIRGLGGSESTKLRRTGLLFFIYVLCTTLVASSIGILMGAVFQPGAYVKVEQSTEAIVINNADDVELAKDLPASIVNIIPENPLQSAINGEMLGVVIFSILLGIAFAIQPRKKVEPFLKIMDNLLDVCMTIVKWAMWLVPWAVFGLMARMASQFGIQTILGMGMYVCTVLLGLLLLLIFYWLIIVFVARANLKNFIRSTAHVQLLAFSTSSSAAVMPLSIRTAEERLDVDHETAEIIVPLGAIINMDGTALYQSIAIVFLAQVAGIALTVPQIFLIVFTLVAASIGTPSTPGVGMVMLTSVASSFGIPLTGHPLIMGVDRILDMCRTAINVTGDLTACLVLDKKKQSFWKRWRKH